MANLQFILKDPEFYKLSVQERQKVLMKVDPQFGGLPPEEQIKVVNTLENNFNQPQPAAPAMQAPQNPLVEAAMMSDIGEDSDVEYDRQITPEVALRHQRPLLEAAGTTLGALVGSAGGPLGTLAGGTLGYGMSKRGSDIIDEFAGKRESLPPLELAKETVGDLKTGAMLEMGGQFIGPAAIGSKRGIQWTYNKLKDVAKGAFAKSGVKKEAGKQLAAHTSYGDIYVKNADEAAALEQEIPGLKFSLAQKTGDPGLIKLEKSQVRKPGQAAEEYFKSVDQNSKALSDYFEKNVSGKQSFDDAIDHFRGVENRLTQNVQKQKDKVFELTGRLSPDAPQVSGPKITSSVKAAMEPVKKRLGELEREVRNVPIKFENTIQKVKDSLADESLSVGAHKAIKDFVGDFRSIIKRKPKGGTSHKAFAVRRTLRDRVDQAYKSGEGTAGKILQEVRDTVRKDLESSIDKSMMEYNRYAKTQYFQRFKEGAVGRVTRRGKEVGGLATRTENIVKEFTTPSGADNLISAVGEKQANDIMRGHFTYDLNDKVMNKLTGEVSAGKLKSWLSKHKEVLKKFNLYEDYKTIANAQDSLDLSIGAVKDFEKSISNRVLKMDTRSALEQVMTTKNTGKIAEELLRMTKGNAAAQKGLRNSLGEIINDQMGKATTMSKLDKLLAKYTPAMEVLYKNEPEKIVALKNVQKAYKIAMKSSKSPFAFGSDSAENFFTQLGKTNVLSKWVTVPKGILRAFSEHGENKAEDLLSKALFDPDYAKVLYDATSYDVPLKELKTRINSKIMGLDYYNRSRLVPFAGGGLAGGRAELKKQGE